jgi:hypothetical protein
MWKIDHCRLVPSRQGWLQQHCQFELRSGSVAEPITASLHVKPTVLAWATLPALEHHCLLGPQCKPAVLAWASLPARATSQQCWLEHHCQLVPQARSVGLSITVDSFHKPAVLAWASLPARATSQQCLLEHHCRLVPQAGSVSLADTVGWCQEPIVLPTHHWRFWVPAVMWTPYHCRFKIRQ